MKDTIATVLWDIKKENIPTLSRDFVMQRTLTYGTIELIIESIREYGVEYICTIFNSLKPTALSKKKYLYLKEYLLK
jgi:hypothetical protein